MRYCYRDAQWDIRETLYHNLGRPCTIFTTFGGGARGEGFTGILSEVDAYTCRLICPLRGQEALGRRYRYREREGLQQAYGNVQTIPLDKITCVSTAQF